jgi:hypothetical protein
VALWFALNDVETNIQELFYYNTGFQPLPIKIPSLHFIPHENEPAWFYVLDVPVWNGDPPPKHGDLIDLTNGPDFIANCVRVNKQKGALLYGDCTKNGGDLSFLYACPPIEIARPFKGSSLIDKPFEDLFPPMEEDQWFDRLLQAPLVPQPDEKDGFAYKQSLGVYIISDKAKMEADSNVIAKQTERMSILARAGMRATPETLKEIRSFMGVDPEESTYIQLDVPFYTALPSMDSWNQSLLNMGFCHTARPQLIDSDYQLPAVSLDNVIIQLSPLETALFDQESPEFTLSAIWIIKTGEGFKYTVLYTQEDRITITYASFIISFSKERGCFEAHLKDKKIPLLESDLPFYLLKGFFIGLYVIRGLSDKIKPDPFFGFTFGEKGLLPIRGMSTRLVRYKNDPGDYRLHFLANSQTGETYEGPTLDLPSVATLDIEPAKKLLTAKSAHELFGYTTNVGQIRSGLDLPQRNGTGFNKEIADYLVNFFNFEDAE